MNTLLCTVTRTEKTFLTIRKIKELELQQDLDYPNSDLVTELLGPCAILKCLRSRKTKKV